MEVKKHSTSTSTCKRDDTRPASYLPWVMTPRYLFPYGSDTLYPCQFLPADFFGVPHLGGAASVSFLLTLPHCMAPELTFY